MIIKLSILITQLIILIMLLVNYTLTKRNLEFIDKNLYSKIISEKNYFFQSQEVLKNLDTKIIEKYGLEKECDEYRLYRNSHVIIGKIKSKDIKIEKSTKNEYIKNYNNILKILKMGNFSNIIFYKNGEEISIINNIPYLDR